MFLLLYQAALAYRAKLFEVTKEYADGKLIPNLTNPAEPKALSSIPQLKALFQEAESRSAEIESFVAACEDALTPLLRVGASPDPDLAHAIATAKVKAVEVSTELCTRLKQEVGSYALMGTSGFKHLDFLLCCKFAEGW
jgi:acyl-CoA oxidase